MKKSFSILSLILFAMILGIDNVDAGFAEEFPVKELGNCSSEIECHNYCDVPSNMDACINYGEMSGRLSGEELQEVKKFLPLIKNGETPGKCKSKKECDDYCNKDVNFNECVDFAVRIGEVTPDEAEIAKKTGGVGPGGCKRDECKKYCEDESHLLECLDFAEQHGMIDKSDADRMRKIRKGGGPGGCKSPDECDRYCQGESHMEECIAFSVELGETDAKEAGVMIACKGDKETCDNYCYTDEHFEDCIAVWKKGGLSPEQERVEKLYWYSHPGGCKFDRACAEEFCSKYENFEECWRFEVETGFMSKDEYQRRVDEMKADKERDEREAREEQERIQSELEESQKNDNAGTENSDGAQSGDAAQGESSQSPEVSSDGSDSSASVESDSGSTGSSYESSASATDSGPSGQVVGARNNTNIFEKIIGFLLGVH